MTTPSPLAHANSETEALRRGTRRLLLACAALMLALLIAILMRQGLFRQTAALQFVTNSAHDISRGASVKIAGFRVGAVKDLTLQDDGQVAVQLEIDSNYMRFVTHDAVVELRKDGLVGGSTLEIVPGPDKAQLATDNAMLRFVRSDGLSGIADTLRDKIVPILGDVKVITGTLADPNTGLAASLEKVHGATSALSTLLHSANQQVDALGGAAKQVLGRADDDLSRLSNTLQTVNTTLPPLMSTVQDLSNHVDQISADVQSAVPPLLQDGGAVVSDVRNIVDGAKTTWPVRNLLAKPDSDKLPMDSDPHGQTLQDTH